MRFLFDALRPQIDETALFDDEYSATHPAPPSREPVARWKPVMTCVVIALFGIGLLAGVVLIGVRVDWVLTDTIPWKGTQVWAWPPMMIISILGGAMTWFGVYALVDLGKHFRNLDKKSLD